MSLAAHILLHIYFLYAIILDKLKYAAGQCIKIIKLLENIIILDTVRKKIISIVNKSITYNVNIKHKFISIHLCIFCIILYIFDISFELYILFVFISMSLDIFNMCSYKTHFIPL